MQTRRILFALAMTLTLVAPASARMMKPPAKQFYAQTNYDGFNFRAKRKDQFLINPWGIAYGPGTAIWIADNNAGVSTLYNAKGKLLKPVVGIPAPMGTNSQSTPTGVVYNPHSSEFGGALFIFCTEDGTISTWNQSDGTAAKLMVDNSAKDSVYKAVAMGSNASGDLIFVTDLHNDAIDVFDKNFTPVTVSGGFSDPSIPANFSPFGIANIGGNLYVSYAMPDAAGVDEVNGAGHGYIDVFDTNGNLMRRLVSQGSLNSPWGMAMAPSNFGPLSGNLLVGNFGDGHINAFNPTTGAAAGQMMNSKSMAIVVDGLWGLVFGNGSLGSPTTLFFTAGPANQSAGVFGVFTVKTKMSMGGGMGGGGGY